MLKHIIEQIDAAERALTLEEVQALLAQPVRKRDLEQWISFSNERYARHAIVRNKWAELLAICWLPGQASAPHHHGGSIGGMRIIDGSAREIGFDSQAAQARVTRALSIKAREVSLIEADVVHQVGNFSDRPLISLHLYSLPLSDKPKSLEVKFKRQRVSAYGRQSLASTVSAVSVMVGAS